MKSAFVLPLLAALLQAPALERQSERQPNQLFDKLDQTVRQLSEITGLELRHKVAYDMIDRPDLKRFLERRIKEEIKPEDIRVEEMLLKKFGFVPPDFDLKETTVELYTEQAAAFYDFKKKKLFVLESDDPETQEAALTHELAHALADQHFRLQRYLDRAGKNDDGALARMAVLEGQATWLMAELSVQRTGRSLKDSPDLFAVMARMIGSSQGEFPVLDKAPLYLRESLIFPYTGGMRFQQAIVEKMGRKAFTEVFRRPPATTQQVLHPEKYLDPVPVKAPDMPRLARANQYAQLAEGTLGEFDFSVLLRQFAGDDAAKRIAPRWTGGAYRFLEHRRNKRTVLLHVSAWETPETAAEFFRLYRKVLDKKWKSLLVSQDTRERFSGQGDDGYFVVRLDGSQVICAEGLAALADLL
ncbi:MAG: hypothetical protein KIT09_09105 [Bryobacteraceae bacterium]|nr:hypothetical protein [Bryobacteraceae bacterium]